MTLVRSGVLLTLAIGLANVLNAAFQFSLARILEPDEYALLAALFAVVIVAAIPPLAFQATAAREVSVRLERGDEHGAGVFLHGMARSVIIWTDVLLVAAIVAGGIAVLADMDDPLAAGATVITIAAALGIPVVWGGLQGAGRFYSLSVAHVLFAGTRLAAGLVIALAGGSVGAVMVGVGGRNDADARPDSAADSIALRGGSRRGQAGARDSRQRRRRSRPDDAVGPCLQRFARSTPRVLR